MKTINSTGGDTPPRMSLQDRLLDDGYVMQNGLLVSPEQTYGVSVNPGKRFTDLELLPPITLKLRRGLLLCHRNQYLDSRMLQRAINDICPRPKKVTLSFVANSEDGDDPILASFDGIQVWLSPVLIPPDYLDEFLNKSKLQQSGLSLEDDSEYQEEETPSVPATPPSCLPDPTPHHTGPKVGVVGSRRRSDRWRVTQFINSLPADAVVVSGGCRGVDSWAEETARKRGLQVETHPPDYTRFSTLSYHEKCQRYYDRNKIIAKSCGSLHAFTGPDRKGGSENTVKAALSLGREVTIHDPDGNTYLSAPSSSDSLHITKGLLNDLEMLPGVRRAWPYRGRVHMAVQSNKLLEIGKMVSFTMRTLRRDGPITLVESTIQTSEAKLKQAASRNAREAYWDVQTHIQHLQHLIATHATEDVPEFAPDIFNRPTVTDSDRCDMEDELDTYPTTNLRAEEGLIGFYTKEDYDLERAQRQYGLPTHTTIPIDGKRPQTIHDQHEEHRDDLSYAQCLSYTKTPEYLCSLLQGGSEETK